MIPSIRHDFNLEFSKTHYENLLKTVHSSYNYAPPFRIAESPLFFDADFRDKLRAASRDIVAFLRRPDFLELSSAALLPHQKVAGSEDHIHFFSIDYAIAEENGSYSPKLIEVQGFPSLFAFQPFLAEKLKATYPSIPRDWTCYFDTTEENYRHALGRVLLGDCAPANVVMMDIEPEKQHTYIDFLWTERLYGIEPVCISKIWSEDDRLYYHNRQGQKHEILRIYNRFIFDELEQRPDIIPGFDMSTDYGIQWVSHPNYFNRISKYLMPHMPYDCVPKTEYLHKVTSLPSNLEDYVLKPLYSFSGNGVLFDFSEEDILQIKDPENYILQEKVHYAPVLQSPTGPVKAEVRVMVLWPENEEPFLAINLVRLSKGKMIGVKYNKDFDWVGGSVAFFPPG